ncbi:DUF2336 domain-containing protein [Lichenihabitans psoromatis]|uniref:DUF2336 domain-containing protein n=1 Tax=Lichenihabitans psoromatis TaxID=2528642 RepID=UPI0010385D3D|nr:DUF2336 domain-containing protein [Lichenihabitans psoromatis]
MPAIDDLPVALERLVALGQSPDVNIRPVLLRVVVDMFVRKQHHAPEDLKQFVTIVSHLLDNADAEARLIVAEKLSRHPATPRALLDRFIAEQGRIALQVYEHAVLDDETLTAAATWGTTDVAAGVAGRRALTSRTIAALAERPEAVVLCRLAANRSVTLDRAVFQHLVRRAKADPDSALGQLLALRESDPIDLAPLFSIVDTDRRHAIIEAARRLDLGKRQWGRLDGTTAASLAHMDRLVMCGERDAFESSLSRALGIEGTSLLTLMHEEGGEVLALALAAVGASPEMAARVFILGDPRIGRSVGKVRALTRIVEIVSPNAARRLIAAMASGTEPLRRTAPSTAAATNRIEQGPLEAAPIRRDTPVPQARRTA